MVIARRLLVRPDVPGCYHLMSRCVRRLHCLTYDERRKWVEGCLRQHAMKMAIDVLTFAVMKNHVHIVIRIRPDLAGQWSAREVVDKWLKLVPCRNSAGDVLDLDDEMRERISSNTEWVQERRARLSSMSWFMRLAKQKISIKMNKADEVTGHFWGERFVSVFLPDRQAVVACMAYVDLNPFRAGECNLPERGGYIGLQIRVEHAAFYEKQERAFREHGNEVVSSQGNERQQQQWIEPLCCCGVFVATRCGYDDKWVQEFSPSLTEQRYLELVDRAAREMSYHKEGRKKRKLSRDVEEIVDRMNI